MNRTSDLSFPILSTSRYLGAADEAQKRIRDRLQKPQFSTFRGEVVQAYPPLFFWGVVAALIAVVSFSFWVSAGKQAAAAGMVFDDLPGRYNHLSSLWSSISIVAMLLLSEVGAILFLVAAGTIAVNAPGFIIRGREVSPIKWVFRIFAGLCAGFAVLSNITITVLDPVPQAGALQWVISIGVPLIVLGLGIMLEQLLIDSLRTRALQTQKYNEALREWQRAYDDPTLSDDWDLILADCLWRELNRYKDVREKLAILVSDPVVKRQVIIAEYQSHQSQLDFTLDAGVSNPFLGNPN